MPLQVWGSICLPVHFNLIKMHKLNLLLCVCCPDDFYCSPFILYHYVYAVLVILLFVVHNLPLPHSMSVVM